MAITRYSPLRVTLGLSTAGAAFGAGAGAVAFVISSVLTGLTSVVDWTGLLVIPVVIGAVLGAVCAPLAGWLLLRHVPLGRMFLGLSIGTVLGGVIGWFLPGFANIVVQPVIMAAAGFLAAAVGLRLRHGKPRAPAQTSLVGDTTRVTR